MKLNKIFFSISLIISATIASMENRENDSIDHYMPEQVATTNLYILEQSIFMNQRAAIDLYIRQQEAAAMKECLNRGISAMKAHIEAGRRDINAIQNNLEKIKEIIATTKATNEAIRAVNKAMRSGIAKIK